MPRQPSEETMLRQVKPILQRGMGFSSGTDGGGGGGRFESGTRESSLGKFSI